MNGDIPSLPYGASTESGGATTTSPTRTTQRRGNFVSGAEESNQSPHSDFVESGGAYGKKDEATFGALPNYLDWALNILLDPSQDLLGNIDFNPEGNIMHKIQYQNSVHEKRYDGNEGQYGVSRSIPQNMNQNMSGQNSVQNSGQNAGQNSGQNMSNTNVGGLLRQGSGQSMNAQGIRNTQVTPGHAHQSSILSQRQASQTSQTSHTSHTSHNQPNQANQANQNNQNNRMNVSMPNNGIQDMIHPGVPPGVSGGPSGPTGGVIGAQKNANALLLGRTTPVGQSKQRRPCDHCRRRKTKCVIIPGTTNCIQCESKSLTCTYVQMAFKKEDGDEPAAKRPRQDLENSGAGSTDIIPPNVLIRDVPPVQDYLVMNNLLLRKTLLLQFPRSSFYVGPTSYLFDWTLLDSIIGASNTQGRQALSKIEQINLSDTVSLRKVGERTQFVLKDDQSKQLYQNMLTDVDAIEKFVAPHGQMLIDLYFRIIHPLYPVLHKKVFLEKYLRTHREFSAPLLAAVYLLAIHWWDYDPQLNRFPKPNVHLILKIALNNYLSEILKRPKLSAVQAGLLLLQCKHVVHAADSGPGLGSFNDADYNDWVLCLQVVALAEELGLGLDCDHWKLPKWERGLRKRLAWAVYMEDKWLALKNARPSHVSDDNWVVLQLVEYDFPEKHGDGDLKEGSSDINNGKKNFLNLIELLRILADILSDLYLMRAMRDVCDINSVLHIAKPIQLRLRSWYHSLPVELQMALVQPRKLCSNGYLQLAYFAAELTLHRKIITVIQQQIADGANISSELVNVCRTAAKTRLLASIEFVRDLKPEHIHSFWHLLSAANFTLIGTFGALLFVTALTQQEADFYKDQIFNYRWILKILSKGFVQAAEALQKMDLVLGHVPGLLNESADQPMVVPNVPTIDYTKMQSQPQPNQPQPSQPQPVQQTLLRFNSPGSTNGYNGSSFRPNYAKDMTRPSSAQQYRVAQQSPYASPQTFSTPSFSQAGRPGISPQSSQGVSPKEMVRQPKSTLGHSRRGSSASHNSEAKDGASPVMTRSPLANQVPPADM